MDWVCDDAWKGPFTQAAFMMGSVVGCFIFGVASDKFGRMPGEELTFFFYKSSDEIPANILHSVV
jgi:MFS family permease